METIRSSPIRTWPCWERHTNPSAVATATSARMMATTSNRCMIGHDIRATAARASVADCYGLPSPRRTPTKTSSATLSSTACTRRTAPERARERLRPSDPLRSRAGFPSHHDEARPLQSIAIELLWFLRGEGNVAFLRDNGVTIWDEWGGCLRRPRPGVRRPVAFVADAIREQIDQIADVIEQIKVIPDPRRLIVSAWNPADIPRMALAPCHALFQFYAADGKLSCQLYQRSGDMFLGVPFNIAKLTRSRPHMVAQQTGLEVGRFHLDGRLHAHLQSQPRRAGHREALRASRIRCRPCASRASRRRTSTTPSTTSRSSTTSITPRSAVRCCRSHALSLIWAQAARLRDRLRGRNAVARSRRPGAFQAADPRRHRRHGPRRPGTRSTPASSRFPAAAMWS